MSSDDVDHVAADGADELAHVRVPLKMEAAHGSGAGEALVGLEEADAAHEGRRLAVLEVAEPVLLAEVAAVVGEAGEADHLDLRDGKLVDLDDLHPAHSSQAGAMDRGADCGLSRQTVPTAVGFFCRRS